MARIRDIKLNMKIWRRTFWALLSHDAFPLQPSALKIEQDGQLERGDCQITNHLRDMSVIKHSNDLGIDDHFFVND